MKFSSASVLLIAVSMSGVNQVMGQGITINIPGLGDLSKLINKTLADLPPPPAGADGVTVGCRSGDCMECTSYCYSGSATRCTEHCYSGSGDSCTDYCYAGNGMACKKHCHAGIAPDCTCSCHAGLKAGAGLPECSD